MANPKTASDQTTLLVIKTINFVGDASNKLAVKNIFLVNNLVICAAFICLWRPFTYHAFPLIQSGPERCVLARFPLQKEMGWTGEYYERLKITFKLNGE